MTRPDILSRPPSAKGPRRRDFRKLDVAQKAFLVRYRTHVDLLRNAFMILLVGTGILRAPPPNDRANWMN